MLATELLMQNLYGVDFRKTINSQLMDSFQQAQELEKHQIQSAFCAAEVRSSDYFDPNFPNKETDENYYNQTYKNGQKET